MLTLSPSSPPKRSLFIGGVMGDKCLQYLCLGAALSVITLAALLLMVLLWQSGLAMKTIGFSFLTDQIWDPEPSHRSFGALTFVYGTIITSVIAMIIAVPFGVCSAVFLSEYAPVWLQRLGSSLIEMLAAVPSIVYGFWGLFVLVPVLEDVIRALGGPSHAGVGILPAGIVLAIMIVPYITSISYDVLRAVPRSQRDAGYALGATRWQTIWSIVLPYARPGMMGGCFIALGRALGETMGVTMLIGNRPEIKLSLFAKGNSIASVIANEFTEATYDLYLSALVELGLVLMVVSVFMNVMARILLWRMNTNRTTKSWRVMQRFYSLFGNASRQINAEALHQRTLRIDHFMTYLLITTFILTVAPLFFILGHLIYQGIGSLDWNFFIKLPAPVGETGGGMANACVGSLLLVALATAFAMPIGLGTAIYLVEYRQERLGSIIRFIGELLGSVPSIVIGIFAYALIVKPMGHFSGWAGGFALGVMMVPIFMRAAEGALRLVPDSLRQGSDALGARRWQTIAKVVLPAALSALITALFLSIARIAGETAPLLLTASSNQYWPSSPNDFMPSLPVYIFTYAVSPYEEWHRQAWAAALVLLSAIMILNFGVRFITRKSAISAGLVE